jgi:hypothetical protein
VSSDILGKLTASGLAHSVVAPLCSNMSAFGV